MPERLGGLMREEIGEVFEAFNNIASYEDIVAAIKKDPRLRLPVFHAMLRQECVQLNSRADLPPEFKEILWARYHGFFEFLHTDLYSQRVAEVSQALPKKRPDRRGPAEFGELMAKAVSQSELALAAVCCLQRAGLWGSSGERIADRGTVLRVDRASPVEFLNNLLEVESPGARHAHEDVKTLLRARMAEDLPASRGSLACAIAWFCLSCGTEFADLHKCYVDATSDGTLLSSISEEGFNEHRCPGCGELTAVTAELLATELDAELDPLLASCCICIPHPNMRICLPPPLTTRSGDADRVLEIRLSHLEKICEHILHTKEAKHGIISYRMAYHREERLQHISEARAMMAHFAGDPEKIALMGSDALVAEVTQKVKSGLLPLDMALEHVRKFAQLSAIDIPTLILPNDVGGDPIDSLVCLAVALTIAEEKEIEWSRKALIASMCANAYLRVGDTALGVATLHKARTYYERAVRAGEQQIDRIGGIILGDEAEILQLQREDEAAIEKFREAIECYNRLLTQAQLNSPEGLEMQQNRMVMLNKLGLAYMDTGQFSRALQQFHEIDAAGSALAETVLREARAETGSELSGDGFYEYLVDSAQYLRSGALANCGATLNRIIDSLSRFSERLRPLLGAAESVSLIDLAAASAESGPEFERFWDNVLDVCGRVLGSNSLKLDEELIERLRTEAIATFRGALELSEGAGGHNFAAIQATALGTLLIASQAPADECLRVFERAVEHARVDASRETLAHALEGLSRACEMAGDLAGATGHLDEAINAILQSMIASGTSYFHGSRHRELELWADRLASLYEKTSQPYRVIEAAENVKSNLLALELERSAPAFSDLGDDELMGQLRALQARREHLWYQVISSQESLGQALAPVRTVSGIEAVRNTGNLTEEIQSVHRQIRELKERLILNHPQFASWCRWSTIEPFRLRDLNLEREPPGTKTAIAGFFLSEETLWAYRLWDGDASVESYRLNSSAIRELETAVRVLRNELATRAPASAVSRLTGAFKDTILPVFEDLAGRTPPGTNLLIAPYGVLNWMPWALLPLSGGLLVEHFTMHQVFSLGVLEKLWRKEGVSDGSDGVLLVADPLRGTDSELPGAAREAEIIRSLCGTERDCAVLLGQQATLQSVVDLSRNREVIHFSCHGSFGGLLGNPGQLFLAPSRGPDHDSGVLTPEKIIDRLRLRSTRLVNMAACEVGLVEANMGTEIDGISRAFLSAGADAVMGSLWPLEDSAACAFTERFYINYFKDARPAAALRETQLACLRGELGENMAQPANWAGYVLIAAPERDAPSGG